MADKGIRYQYTLEMFKRDPHESLGAVPIQPDWEPLREWVRLAAVRLDRHRPLRLGHDGVEIEPCWDERRGNPYLAALQAMVTGDGPATVFQVPLSYFHSLARSASSPLVESGKLAAGEVFEYLVCAYPCPEPPVEPAAPAGLRLSVKPLSQDLPVDQQPLGGWLAASSACGAVDEGHLPVFVPRYVLQETAELMESASAQETGGILIGHLHRDSDQGDLFLEVSAQIPVRHAQQELTRLTFTPESWAAVDAAIALRRRGEMYLGWWHSHPAEHWCDDCPPDTKQRCKSAGKLSGDFFSLHDVALHRTVFPRAYSVALVVSRACAAKSEPVWRLYGWHYGMIVARGFYVLEGAELAAVSGDPN